MAEDPATTRVGLVVCRPPERDAYSSCSPWLALLDLWLTIDAMLRVTPAMQLLSWCLDLGKPVVALQAPPRIAGARPVSVRTVGVLSMGGGRYDPGMTEPALPALALDRLAAVVFDTHGVLTDTASVHAAAWTRLFDENLRLRATRDGDATALPIRERPGPWQLAPQLILASAAAGPG